jgi:hypothetical protein
MTPDDTLLNALASLPEWAPNRRQHLVRMRCHEELRHRAKKRTRAAHLRHLAGQCFDASAGLGACAYALIVLHAVIRLAL